MSDAEGSTTYEYDERGNLSKTTRNTNSQPYATQYVYDLNDRLLQLTYPSGRVVDYTRNTLGQVTQVTTTPNGGSPQIIANGMTYLPFGALENMSWGNGLSLNQTYDSDYRLTSQVLGAVYDRIYGYDVVNNIKSITDNTASAKNQAFNYDVLDRLDDATSTGSYGALDYVYDDVGNRISLTLDGGVPEVYNYSATANQVDDIDGAVITYDAVGNTKTKSGLTFTYDDTNRMVQAGSTGYGFNGRGERVRKTGAVTTLYHYDNSGNLLFESDTSGSTTTEYIWLVNQRLAMVQGGGLYFTHVDHLGTVQLLTDSGGSVVWRGDYDPFGKVNNITGSVTYNLRFPGQYYDSETGLHYNYFRYYDPESGRYITGDPIGLAGGINTYAYVGGNPLYWIDPLGLNRNFNPFQSPIPIRGDLQIPVRSAGLYVAGENAPDFSATSATSLYWGQRLPEFSQSVITSFAYKKYIRRVTSRFLLDNLKGFVDTGFSCEAAPTRIFSIMEGL